jgi:hypothetical protein
MWYCSVCLEHLLVVWQGTLIAVTGGTEQTEVSAFI